VAKVNQRYKQQFHFGAYTETVSDFQVGNQKFFVFKKELTGPRTGFSQIHLCETGTRARTILVYFLQTKTQRSSKVNSKNGVGNER
jgi:hypothetical protein